jgi:hypothetical protein
MDYALDLVVIGSDAGGSVAAYQPESGMARRRH